jgi:hypothetical protein
MVFFTAGAETVFGAEVVCLLMRTILFAGAGVEILGAGGGVEILTGAGEDTLGGLTLGRLLKEEEGLERKEEEELDRKDEPELKEEDERKEDELLAPKLFA